MTQLERKTETLDSIFIRSWGNDAGEEYFRVEEDIESASITWKKKDEITISWLLNWMNEFIKDKEIQRFCYMIDNLHLQGPWLLELEAIPPVTLSNFTEQGIEPDKIVSLNSDLGPFTICFKNGDDGKIGIVADDFQSLRGAEDLIRQTAKVEPPFTIHDFVE